MSDVTLRINGGAALEVLRGTIHLPRLGMWTAEFDLGEPNEASGTAVLANADGSAPLVGFATRTGKYLERGRVVVVGGAAGRLGAEVPARFYRGALLHGRVIARDILTAVGEEIDTTTLAPEMTRDLGAWVRRRASAADELWRLADALGVIWRVRPDGKVSLHHETWADVAEFEHDELDDDPALLLSTLSMENLVADLLPGRTFNGWQVASVTYHLDGPMLRAVVQGWRGPGRGDAMESLRGTIRQTIAVAPDDGALYPARLDASLADGTIDCTPQYDLDAAKRTLPALTSVPLRLPIPGAILKVAAGAVVLVGFEGGDPRYPYATLWQSGQTTELGFYASTRLDVSSAVLVQLDAPAIKIGSGAVKPLGLDGDPVMIASPWSVWLTALASAAGYAVAPPVTALGTLDASATKGLGE